MNAQTLFISLFCSVMLSACTASPSTPPNPTDIPSPNDTTSIIAPDVTLEPFPTDKKITVSGTADCLPKKNPGEMQTLECAYGIKTADNKYYGLRIDNDTLFGIEIGKTYAVEGYFKEDQNSIYNTVGTILVTSLK